MPPVPYCIFDGKAHVMYTVTSRGRAIGVADLSFVRIHPRIRSGWFHPNAEGERLMPIIAAVLPAMRAYADADPEEEEKLPTDEVIRKQALALADLAEAVHREQALDLVLHREDGSVVPTEDVGIKDTEQLLALAEEAEARNESSLPWESDRMRARALEIELEEELAEEDDPDLPQEVREAGATADAEGIFSDEDDLAGPWTPEDEEPVSFPRYQIHVFLLEPNAIP